MTPVAITEQPQQVTSIINFNITASNNALNRFIKNYLKDCPECKTNPAVLLTADKIPACRHHWIQLADKNINWSSAKQ
jgi:uncharacterized protein YpmS